MKFCIFHDWVKEEFIETKVNSFGILIDVYLCKCTKCGKTKIMSFLAPKDE